MKKLQLIAFIFLFFSMSFINGQIKQYVIKGNYLLSVKDSNYQVESYWGGINDISTIMFNSKKDKSMIFLYTDGAFDFNNINDINTNFSFMKKNLGIINIEIFEKNNDYIICKMIKSDSSIKNDTIYYSFLNVKFENQTISFLISIEKKSTLDSLYLQHKEQIELWKNSIKYINESNIKKQFKYSNLLNNEIKLASLDSTIIFDTNSYDFLLEFKQRDTIETYFYDYYIPINSIGSSVPYIILNKNTGNSYPIYSYKNKYYCNVYLPSKLTHLNANEIVFYDSVKKTKTVYNIELNQSIIRKPFDTSFNLFKNFNPKILISNKKNIIPLSFNENNPELFDFKIDNDMGFCEFNSELKQLIVTPKNGIKQLMIKVNYFNKTVFGISFTVEQ